jgi:hypothetical protein
MWFVTSQKHGASALGLKRVLGLGSYNTAWTWLHKLRRAMVRPGRDQLTGGVEVDETYVGGVGTKIRGRGAKRKTIVAIAAEVRGRGPGRIRMAKIPDLSAPSLQRFVRDNVQRGSELRTDGWSGYNGIEVMGYKHAVISISDSGDPAHVVMPRVHRVASFLTDGGLAFIRVRLDRRIWITISTNLPSDLIGVHPKPVVYSFTV